MKRALRSDRLAIGLILLAGLALRLFRLGSESLWYDETVSVYLAGSPFAELLRHTAGDIHPPGYYLLLRGWLLLAGYGDGRADPQTFGLEFFSAFLSLFFGVLLIALVYSLARKVGGQNVALVAAAFVALSPFNIWYSQEVRMYTVGAALGIVAFRALLALIEGQRPRRAAVAYAVAAALGMYALYYFAFLLIALNAWALVVLLRRRRGLLTLLLANVAAAILYAPWIPVAFRQATQPPVPPWRTAPDLLAALMESWTALSLGQSAPAWTWPALPLTLALYVLGLVYLARRHGGQARASGLATATFGPLLLILLVSFATPLYHVRYLFTYSPAFYVGLGAGVVALGVKTRDAARGRFGAAGGAESPTLAAASITLLVWALAAAVTLAAFWSDPAFRPDDHRAAVRELEARWRPGDVVLVNAGWPYTALATYWTGDVAGRTRITEELPEPRADRALVMVTSGHTDGDPSLGWGDPRSDFFA
ncbi:MAG: glycosyltransferase family 39 protein, partial [Anaerolineae bacterium]|nr:glycosyltransferase family 39 protein [Anaerolineae bacterium]